GRRRARLPRRTCEAWASEWRCGDETNSWCYLLIEDLVLGVLDRVLHFDTTQPEHGLMRDNCLADRDILITSQQFFPRLDQLLVLVDGVLGRRLVGRGLALELGARGILVAGDGGGFLIGRLPFLQRLVAFGEALVELVDRFAVLLLDL